MATLQESLVSLGTIDQQDLNRFIITDSPREAAKAISEIVIPKYELKSRAIKRSTRV